LSREIFREEKFFDRISGFPGSYNNSDGKPFLLLKPLEAHHTERKTASPYNPSQNNKPEI
jgi:hypothetical protein